MARILVFGGGGWVGRPLVAALCAAGHDVRAPAASACDIADARLVGRAVDEARPAAIVNLAAVNPGGGDEARMRAVNATGAGNVAAVAARSGARLVHVSTDVVLGGDSPPYRDDAPARPVNAYGRTKAAGEAAVLAACPGAVAVRTSLVFDPGAPDPSTRGFVERLARGEPCRLFTDEIRCPIARATLVAALVELIGLGVAGTLNVAGTEPLSRYDFGTLLLEHFGAAGRERVEPARAKDLAEPRPLDLTLDVSKARALLVTQLVGARAALRGDDAQSGRDGTFPAE